jgi:cytochrome oxidase Cu insertion factor (SCO1/SenC/PrrC family)
VANPVYRGEAFVQAFDAEEQLAGWANWLFLTGDLSHLEQAWNAYGIQVETVSAGGMVAHSETAFVVDASGHLRAEMGSDLGEDNATASSFATLLADEMRNVMAS